MFETLNEIQKDYPELVIVIGTDANHNLEDKNNFRVFPNNREVTTRKKRTDMQCQFGKAGKLIE
jgi:hypothetical protein